MGNNLRDQLLKAGLVDEKRVRKVKQAKRQEQKQHKGGGNADDAEARQAAARKAQAEKAERDRELNRQHQELAARRALEAQVRQLIENNRVPAEEGDILYNFVDENKVKRMYVTKPVRDQLTRGQLAIVKIDKRYRLVPAEAAEKIRARDESYVILWNEAKGGSDGEDPYADHPIPDDLMW